MGKYCMPVVRAWPPQIALHKTSKSALCNKWGTRPRQTEAWQQQQQQQVYYRWIGGGGRQRQIAKSNNAAATEWMDTRATNICVSACWLHRPQQAHSTNIHTQKYIYNKIISESFVFFSFAFVCTIVKCYVVAVCCCRCRWPCAACIAGDIVTILLDFMAAPCFFFADWQTGLKVHCTHIYGRRYATIEISTDLFIWSSKFWWPKSCEAHAAFFCCKRIGLKASGIFFVDQLRGRVGIRERVRTIRMFKWNSNLCLAHRNKASHSFQDRAIRIAMAQKTRTKIKKNKKEASLIFYAWGCGQ